MIELGYDFERRLNDMLRSVIAANSIKPITLGGVAGPSGGVGSPIGSFIGQLSQVYITYDTTEAAINTPSPLPSGVSLVTNLNKIRYDISQIDSRVTVLESGDITTFLGLSDTPASYSGQGKKALIVNNTETALEFKGVVMEQGFTWFVNGILATGVHPLLIENLFNHNLLLKKMKCNLGTYATGSGVTVDILINGQSSLTPDYYYIPESQNGSLLYEESGFALLYSGDTIEVDIRTVGSTVAGYNLTVQVIGEVL